MLNDYDDFWSEFLNPYELGYLLKDPTFANAYRYLPQLIRDLSVYPVHKIIEMLEGRQEELSDGAIRTNMLPWDSHIEGEHYMPLCLDIEEWREQFLRDAEEKTMVWDSDVLYESFKVTECPERWFLWSDCVCGTSLSSLPVETLTLLRNITAGYTIKEIWECTPFFLLDYAEPLKEEILCL